jgi:DNA repair exonuclease SbcCD nuclease subunit
LYDIRGNLPALEAVLRDVQHADVDQIVVGGDVLQADVLQPPSEKEMLEALRETIAVAEFRSPWKDDTDETS